MFPIIKLFENDLFLVLVIIYLMTILHNDKLRKL